MAGMTFTNPIIVRRGLADPWICRSTGWYYLTGTVQSEDRILIWRGRNLAEMEALPPRCVWRAQDRGGCSAGVWAPELYCFDGRWIVYFTASDGRDDNHRHFVLRASDPLGPYEEIGLVDPLNDQYAIDGSVMVMGNDLYWLYATYDGIWIARMDTPVRVGPQRTRIVVGDQVWERAWNKIEGAWVRSSSDFWIEAPQPLVRNGRVFLTYSAGHSATPQYAVGMMECKGDVMDAAAWIKHPGPVFAPVKDQGKQVLTVGHASFTTSPDGSEDWIVYHGKDGVGADFSGRTTRAQRFGWQACGAPDFGVPIPTGVSIQQPA